MILDAPARMRVEAKVLLRIDDAGMVDQADVPSAAVEESDGPPCG